MKSQLQKLDSSVSVNTKNCEYYLFTTNAIIGQLFYDQLIDQ